MIRKALFGIFPLFILLPVCWADTMLIGKIKGEVQVLKNGASAWMAGTEGMVLEAGERIKTGDQSSAELRMEKGYITLEEKTEFVLKEFQSKEEQIRASMELTLGKLKARVKKMKTGSEFKITTPTSVAAVRGTFFDLWVYLFQGSLFTRLDVSEGLVHFSDLSGQVEKDVQEGQTATGGLGEVTNPKPTDSGGGDSSGPPETIDQASEETPGFQQETLGSQENSVGSPVQDSSSNSSSSRSGKGGSGNFGGG